MKSAILIILLLPFLFSEAFPDDQLSIAVEFNSHAAAFYIAMEKGLFERENLKIASFESYLTGVALASSIKKGSIDGAYMCVHPAIAVYANGGVNLKIVSGTHLFGYGLAVNPKRIGSIKDLERKGIRIGCVAPGSGTDLVLRKTIDFYQLNEDSVLSSVIRTNPPNMILALRSGSIDAAFLPEHFLTMAEKEGFKVLLTARELWPGFQGSVIVIKDEVLKSKPEAVRKLVLASKKATDFLNANPYEASMVLSRYLSLETSKVGLSETIDPKAKLNVDPNDLLRSMSRMRYQVEIEEKSIQDIIDFMAEKGYIRERFPAQRILFKVHK